MAGVIGIISLLVGLGSLACWIMVLVKMFPAAGVGKGIFGVICGLYALIWGWQNKDTQGLQKIMPIWTGLVLVSIVVNILARTMH